MAYEITSEPGLLRVRLEGELIGEELLTLAAEVARLESASPTTPHRLTDLRLSAGTNITFTEIHRFAEQRNRLKLGNSIKSALIAPLPVQFGMARMFQSFNRNPRITIAIFPDEDQARAWLREPGCSPPAKPWTPVPADGA